MALPVQQILPCRCVMVAEFDRIPGDELTPELLTEAEEQIQHLLDMLGDGTLRNAAIRRMEGFIDREIAEKLDVTEGTVERKLKAIRGARSMVLAE